MSEQVVIDAVQPEILASEEREAQELRFLGLRKLAGKAAIGAASAISMLPFGAAVTAVGSEVYTNDPTAGFDYAYDYLTGDTCDPVDPSIQAQVAAAMAAPENPEYARLGETITDSDDSSSLYFSQKDEALTVLAESLGLTVIPRTPYDEMINDTKIDQDKQKLYEILTQFLGEYDIDLNFADSFSVNEMPYDIDYIDLEAIDYHSLNRLAKFYLNSYSNQPVELVKSQGAEEIKLTGGISTHSGTHSTSLASYGNSVIFVDVNSVGFVDKKELLTSGHEPGHLMDEATCGVVGMHNDSEVKATADLDVNGKLEPWKANPHVDYRSDDPAEIKADDYSQIFLGEFPKGQSPAIRERFKILVSRIASIPKHGINILKYYSSLWDKDVFDAEAGENTIPVYTPPR